MNWVTERDSNYRPIRMWWSPEASKEQKRRETARKEQDAINALPMRSMREWALKRGINYEK